MTGQLGMLLLLMGVMYFLIIRPQREQEKKHEQLVSKLKPGDVVRTDSGIRGEVVKLTGEDAELLVAERTKIVIHRRRIAGLEKAPEAAQKAKE